MTRGYTGANNLFHHDRDCSYLHDAEKEMSEMAALKRGYNYCPECTDNAQ